MKSLQLAAVGLASLVASISCTLTPNTFYLLCYKQDDLKCQEAEREVSMAYEKLGKDPQYQMIPRDQIPRMEVIECLQGQNRERCKGELGHNMHELMPPRIKIVPSEDNTKVYRYSSPIKAEFVLRKLMKFTVPVPVIPL
jgi:hypothetical protein